MHSRTASTAVQGVLLLFHCRSRTEYAIASLERTFHAAGTLLAGQDDRVFYAYSSLESGLPTHATIAASHVTEARYFDIEPRRAEELRRWVTERSISHVLAFDLPVRSDIAPILRLAGVGRVVSYWGASISDLYPWYLRPLRRIQFHSTVARPDHFIFESEGMRERAVLGAGVPFSRTSVVYLGVDTEQFKPGGNALHAYEAFGIPLDRKIVFFSGHMEPRKGVDVLIRAIGRLVEAGRRDVHLLLAGDNAEDRQRLSAVVTECGADAYVTFGGYRTDIRQIHGSVSVGVVASTGWDSYTMSAVELSASGVPLVVSDLPGLREAVEPDGTGLRVPPGDAVALAHSIGALLDDPDRRGRYSRRARELVVRTRSIVAQSHAIARIVSPSLNRS